MNAEKKRIPIKDRLWATPHISGEKPQLIGSQCNKCGEFFFPLKENGLCSNCQSTDMREVKLSSRGKIYSYSVIMQRPPVYYKGEVPYAIGFVELPEGVRVETLFTGCNLEDLKVGVEAEMLIERLHEDEEGNEIITYKFKPVVS